MTPDLHKLRHHYGYTQEYVAKELNVSRPTYIQIEKGERELTISEAQKLSVLYGLSLDDFLAGKTEAEHQVELVHHKKGYRDSLKIKVPSNKVGKFKEILLYILGKIGAQPNIGQTTLYKILYFIDFDYYEKYGEKLIGITYIKNHYGPTPVEFKKIVSEMEKGKELETIKSRYFQYQQKKYLPLRKSNLRMITGQEKEFIDKTVNRLAEKNAKQLSDYSHKDAPWEITGEGKVIDYNLVFERIEPYACRNHLAEEGAALASENIEMHLDQLTKEEYEYYKRITEKNRKKNQMR